MLAAAPGSRATVEVALAMMAGSPRNTRMGKVTMVPPPAMAFINPPVAAAASMIAPSVTVIGQALRSKASWLILPGGRGGWSYGILWGCIVAHADWFSSARDGKLSNPRGGGSAEVMAPHGQHLVDRPEPLSPHRDAAVALLQHPLDAQARRADDQLAMLLQAGGRDAGLLIAGLVPRGGEEQTFRGAGALADDDRAGGA